VKRTLRSCLWLAALAGCAWLVGSTRAQAGSLSAGELEQRQVQQQERFVNMLFGRKDQALQHQLNTVNREQQLVAQQQALANIVPSSASQARAILHQLEHIGLQIQHINNAFPPAILRLENLLAQINTALTRLEQVTPIHPNVAAQLFAFEQQANIRFNQELEAVEGEIINRPPATPFVPSQASDFLGMSGPDPAPIHAASFRRNARDTQLLHFQMRNLRHTRSLGHHP
jgi:hypothetical protein